MKLSNETIFCENEGVPFVSFSAFSEYPEVLAVNSTRQGGVSVGIYESMNLGFTRGDEEKNVRENYRRFCNAIGAPYERLVFPMQTHTINVRVVDGDQAGTGIIRPLSCEDIDGQMTNVRNLPLLCFGSDCVPIFFFDPVHKAIGAAHAGWRGTVGKIAQVMVERMKETYGTDSQDLIVVIGPSICGDCFEIGPEVMEEFDQAFSNAFSEGILKDKKNGKYLADLWLSNKRVLLDAGVPEQNIHLSGECTKCKCDTYWSHRATNGQRGSNASLIMLK